LLVGIGIGPVGDMPVDAKFAEGTSVGRKSSASTFWPLGGEELRVLVDLTDEFELAMGSDNPRNFPLLATPTPQVSVVL
jgi:hypothetical protein